MSERLPHLEERFPLLKSIPYTKTSEDTPAYNRIAHAVGFPSRPWHHLPGGYWPANAKLKGPEVAAMIALFEAQGYECCDNGELEPEYEKVAIYADADGNWQHAARQLRNGRWSSKLGELEDISHKTIQAVTRDDYGYDIYFMRRSLALPRPDPPLPFAKKPQKRGRKGRRQSRRS